jgi:hypothetical protein
MCTLFAYSVYKNVENDVGFTNNIFIQEGTDYLLRLPPMGENIPWTNIFTENRRYQSSLLTEYMDIQLDRYVKDWLKWYFTVVSNKLIDQSIPDDIKDRIYDILRTYIRKLSYTYSSRDNKITDWVGLKIDALDKISNHMYMILNGPNVIINVDNILCFEEVYEKGDSWALLPSTPRKFPRAP